MMSLNTNLDRPKKIGITVEVLRQKSLLYPLIGKGLIAEAQKDTNQLLDQLFLNSQLDKNEIKNGLLEYHNQGHWWIPSNLSAIDYYNMQGRIDILNNLVKNLGFDFNQIRNPYHTICKYIPDNSSDLVKFYLREIKDSQRKLNEADSDGYVPLIHVARKGCKDLTEVMLQIGADPFISTPNGLDSLSAAINEETKKVLIDFRIKKGREFFSRIKALNKSFDTITWMEIEKCAHDMQLQIPIVDIRDPDDRDRTLLMNAMVSGNNTLIQDLINKKANIELKDADGNTADNLAEKVGIPNLRLVKRPYSISNSIVNLFRPPRTRVAPITIPSFRDSASLRDGKSLRK